MKHLRFLPLGLILLAACNEKRLGLIDFTPKAKDTAFITTTVETPQQRIVLIEEFTGVTCANCPTGHKILKSIEDANPDRVALIGIQPLGVGLANPVDKLAQYGVQTIHDNRTQIGTDLMKGIYGNNTILPQVGFDRISESGKMLFDRGDWPAIASPRIMQLPKPM